ncbi:hypothetical protein FB451DRAFT_1399705 [Mycena latifolia]|nr:hypothetical protein FB451DRAFT_1399705 [Mycena latifolia]
MTSESYIKPQSLSYPQIVILKQTLKGSLKLREGLEIPYEAAAGQIVCYEFRGIGMPPNDIGRSGDIFWDVTFPYILYFRGVHTWEAWNPRASEGSQLLAEHPCFRDRFLWMSGAGLSWLARQSLGKTKMDTKQFHTLGDQFQKELAAILRSAPSFDLLSLDIPNNRERHDAELARRRRNGVAVGTAPYTTTVSSLLNRKRTWNEPESGETSRQVQANRNSTPSEEKPSSQVQLCAKTFSSSARCASHGDDWATRPNPTST